MPPASGLGIDHLNTIPTTYEDALKKATILLDRTLRWRRLCFLYELGEREARKRSQALAKRNATLERRHQEDQQNIQRLQRRLRSLLKIPESPLTQEANGEQVASEGPPRTAPRKRGAPVGHRGDTRHVPSQVDVEETIPPPVVCPDCGHCDLTDLEHRGRSLYGGYPADTQSGDASEIPPGLLSSLPMCRSSSRSAPRSAGPDRPPIGRASDTTACPCGGDPS